MQSTATTTGEDIITRLNEELGIRLKPPGREKKRRRSDTLPEYAMYRDDGCDIHESCLTCPLPRCRYEEPGGLRTLLNELRDSQMVRMREKGATIGELASRFGVSRRTVFRVLNSRQAPRQREADAAIAVIPTPFARAGARRGAAQPADGRRAEPRCA